MRRRTSRLNHYGSTSSLQSLGWGRHSCSAEGIRALVEEELHKRRGNCAARTRRLTSLSEYSAYSRESGESSVATGVERTRKMIKRRRREKRASVAACAARGAGQRQPPANAGGYGNAAAPRL